MKVIKCVRAVINRLLFFPYKVSMRNVGRKVLFEAPFVLSGAQYISVGENVRAKSRLQLEAIDFHNGVHYSPEIVLGNNVSINFDVHIACINKVIIGNNVLIASKVFITDHFHGNTSVESLQIAPSQRKLYTKGPVIIEDNVWIGEGCAIMPGVTIGRNCIIGANSVVTKSIPANCVAVGVPARSVKQY